LLPDYYEVLGVSRNAKLTDINRAYGRWVGEFKKESTPPDPRREALLREAHETLSDEQRRDAYDREFAAERAERKGPSGAPVKAIAAVAIVGAVAVGGFFLFRTSSPAGPRERTAEELLAAMSGSVSPLHAYDISGKSTPAGMAFVIEDKVMVANCPQLQPGAQLMVNLGGSRSVAARITLSNEKLGLCKLLTDTYVGEPLRVNTTPPAAGSKIFAAGIGSKGEVELRPATVTKVVDDAAGKAVQAAVPVQAQSNGSPLLDVHGRVVAVATLQPDGKLLHRVVPAAWLAENRPQIQEAKPYQDTGTTATASGSAATEPGAAMVLGQKPSNWDEMGPDEREQWERGQAEIQRRQGAILKGMGGKK